MAVETRIKRFGENYFPQYKKGWFGLWDYLVVNLCSSGTRNYTATTQEQAEGVIDNFLITGDDQGGTISFITYPKEHLK